MTVVLIALLVVAAAVVITAFIVIVREAYVRVPLATERPRTQDAGEIGADDVAALEERPDEPYPQPVPRAQPRERPTFTVLDWWRPHYEAALSVHGVELECEMRSVELKSYEAAFLGVVSEADAAETPTNVFLRYQSTAPDLRIIGISFDAGKHPARLIARRTPEGEKRCELAESGLLAGLAGTRVSVLGWRMTPTLMLLTYVDNVRQSWTLVDDTGKELDKRIYDEAPPERQITFVVSYTTRRQMAALKEEDVDLALIVLDPTFVRLPEREFLVVGSAENQLLDMAFQHEPIPASLVVTRADYIQSSARKRLTSVLEAINQKNAAMVGYFGANDFMSEPADVGVRTLAGVDLAEAVSFRPDVELVDPDAQAVLLADAVNRFADVARYEHVSPAVLRERIVTPAELRQ